MKKTPSYLLASTAFLLCLLCFHSFNAQAQKLRRFIDNSLPDIVYDQRYLDYSKWTFHYNNVLYRPAYAKKLEGVYDIDNKAMRGMNFGVRYTFNRAKQFSYYIGASIDFIPFYYYYYDVPAVEFPEGTPIIGRDFSKWVNDHSVFTIPIGVSWKVPITQKKYTKFNIVFTGDVRIHSIQPGGVSSTVTRGETTFLAIYADAKGINIISPTLNFSAGINWLSKYAIININLNIQKGTVPYLQGEYYFFNLKESPDTRGIYKVRADYAGLEVAITPKKWRRR